MVGANQSAENRGQQNRSPAVITAEGFGVRQLAAAL
jgi:hypothetical protein